MINLIYHEAQEKEREILGLGKEPDFALESIPIFSESVWGIQRKKLTIIGARPSNGKTAFALQLAHDIAKHHSVLFMSLESDTAELIFRLFCNQCGLSNKDVLKNGVAAYPRQWSSFKEGLKDRRLIISDQIGSNWNDILKAIEEDQYKFDIVFLDYIQCVSMKGMTKLDYIEEYIKTLRALAIKHNFGAVVLSQINRTGVGIDNKPVVTGLKNAGFLEEHADKIMLLHWGYYYNNQGGMLNDFEVILAKNKLGKTGKIGLCFYPELYKFADQQEHAKAKQEGESYAIDWNN